MADLRQRRAALHTLAAALTVSACGNTLSGTTGATRDALTAAAEHLPPSYSYVLTSTCGERALLGRFRIVVRDRDTVVSGEPADAETNPDANLDTGDYPSIAALLGVARDAGPDAVVEFETDAAGLPRRLSIDNLPDAIDDEECYAFADIQPVAAGPSPR
jgi:hypothetical protein